MSEHARLAAADLDHAQQLRERAERAEGEAARLRADNEALRSALGGLADAATAYFNKRYVAHALRKGNEDILALADALSVAGPALAAPHPGAPIVAAARAVLDPGADLVAASQALLDAVEGSAIS